MICRSTSFICAFLFALNLAAGSSVFVPVSYVEAAERKKANLQAKVFRARLSSESSSVPGVGSLPLPGPLDDGSLFP